MKKNWNPFLLLTAHPANVFQISVAAKRPEILQRTLSPRWIRASGQLSSVRWIQLLISWYWYNIIFIHWYHFISHTCWYFLEYIWTGPQVEDNFSLNLVCLDPESFSNPAAVWWNCQAVWWNARHSGVGSWGLRSNCERNPYYWKYMFLKRWLLLGRATCNPSYAAMHDWFIFVSLQGMLIQTLPTCHWSFWKVPMRCVLLGRYFDVRAFFLHFPTDPSRETTGRTSAGSRSSTRCSKWLMATE